MNGSLLVDEQIVGLICPAAPAEGGLTLGLFWIGLEFRVLGCFEPKTAFW